VENNMKKTLLLLLGIIVLVALWYFISPLFITVEVNEEAPVIDVVEVVDQATTTAKVPDALLATGQFIDADNFHKGSGEVRVYQVTEEERIVRFEDFSVTNGPDLRVFLTKHENPTNRDEVDEGYIELGKLKGNKGNQNYEIPADVDLSLYKGVVIYCKPFHVVFSKASLK
jgi:hypothetical protein